VNGRRGGRDPEVPPGRDLRGELLRQEFVAGEAAIARPAFGIEDPERGPPVRRPVAVSGDADLRPLADHLPAEANPASPAKLQPEPGTLVHGRPQRGRCLRRHQDEQQGPGAPGERGQPGHLVRRPADPARPEIQHEHVHGSRLEEGARHREGLGEIIRDERCEPFEVDPAGDRLDRVEAPRQVDPGGERTRDLGPGQDPHGQRGRPARGRARDGDRPCPRQAAPGEQRIERREPGGDDVAGHGRARHLPWLLPGEWPRGERPEDLRPPPRRGRAPSFAKAGEGAGGIGETFHRIPNDRTSVL
jgi:hypothetical protein